MGAVGDPGEPGDVGEVVSTMHVFLNEKQLKYFMNLMRSKC